MIKMNIKTKIELGTLGLFLGYTAATCGAGYKIGYYVAEEDAVKERGVCYETLAPVRDDFERECSKKTADTLYNGSLNPILQKRDEITEKNKCPEEAWRCEPTLSSDLQRSEFRAVFRK